MSVKLKYNEIANTVIRDFFNWNFLKEIFF